MQGKLLLLLVIYLVLTSLPAAAAALFAARLGVRKVPVLLAIALVATGLVALLGFWCYYADRLLGETFSYLSVFGSALMIGWSLWGGRIERPLLRQLAIPLALWFFASLFVLFLGFVHGGEQAPFLTADNRYLPFPTDNAIPLFFAEWFFAHGRHGTPAVFPGEWLASDRPPLQSGYVLSQHPFGAATDELHYQVLAVVLQQLWVIGAWALLLAAPVDRLTRGLTMIVLLVSGLVIVNGFFVWPKLLPAAMLLAAALVLTPLWEELRGSDWGAALFAALCGLALLGHGSSVFGAVPLLIVAVLRGGLPSWRWIGIAALVGIVLLAPWSAYQRYGDPPGNRLLKWTLAGVVEIDDRGTTEAIADSYREAGFGGAVHNKAENLVTMVGGGPAVDQVRSAIDSGSLEGAVLTLRRLTFFNLVPSLGLLLLGPIAMALAWRRGSPLTAERRFALLCFAVFLLAILIWGLLVFGNGPDRTAIHVGSYLVPALGLCGCVAALRASFPKFAVPYLGLTALLSLALYVPALDSTVGTSYSFFASIAVAAGLGGFSAVALQGSRDPAPGPVGRLGATPRGCRPRRADQPPPGRTAM